MITAHKGSSTYWDHLIIIDSLSVHTALLQFHQSLLCQIQVFRSRFKVNVNSRGSLRKTQGADFQKLIQRRSLFSSCGSATAEGHLSIAERSCCLRKTQKGHGAFMALTPDGNSTKHWRLLSFTQNVKNKQTFSPPQSVCHIWRACWHTQLTYFACRTFADLSALSYRVDTVDVNLCSWRHIWKIENGPLPFTQFLNQANMSWMSKKCTLASIQIHESHWVWGRKTPLHEFDGQSIMSAKQKFLLTAFLLFMLQLECLKQKHFVFCFVVCNKAPSVPFSLFFTLDST